MTFKLRRKDEILKKGSFKSALNRKDGVSKRKYNVPKMHMFRSVELNSFIDSTIKLTEFKNDHFLKKKNKSSHLFSACDSHDVNNIFNGHILKFIFVLFR